MYFSIGFPTDTLNCAFCQEATLEAEQISEVSDLAVTSPPSQLNFITRSSLNDFEHSQEQNITPLRATRVRRRLTDHANFQKPSRDQDENLHVEERSEENPEVKNDVIPDEENIESNNSGFVVGLRNGFGKVAAGILGEY